MFVVLIFGDIFLEITWLSAITSTRKENESSNNFSNEVDEGLLMKAIIATLFYTFNEGL